MITEAPRAAHQIRVRYRGGKLAVLCTCQNAWDGIWDLAWGYAARNPRWRGSCVRGEPIAARMPFPAADAVAAWRAWHAERGIPL